MFLLSPLVIKAALFILAIVACLIIVLIKDYREQPEFIQSAGILCDVHAGLLVMNSKNGRHYRVNLKNVDIRLGAPQIMYAVIFFDRSLLRWFLEPNHVVLHVKTIEEVLAWESKIKSVLEVYEIGAVPILTL